VAIEGDEGDLGPTPRPYDLALYLAFLPPIFYSSVAYSIEAVFGVPPEPLTPPEVAEVVSAARRLGLEINIPNLEDDVTPAPSLGNRAPSTGRTGPGSTAGGLEGFFGGHTSAGAP
jgi:hypothetical protein